MNKIPEEAQYKLKYKNLTLDQLKVICTGFFLWWYNQSGTNTYQGFDSWVLTGGLQAAMDRNT